VSLAPSKAFDLERELELLPQEQRAPARTFLDAYPPRAGAPLAIVIPAYNEEPTVAEVVAEIPGEAAPLPARPVRSSATFRSTAARARR
jgi:hypothetical protein